MPLKIRQYKKDRVTEEVWTGSLTDAQDIFCQSVRDGTVDRVEIRTSDDRLIFDYPLEVHLTSPQR